MLWNKKMSELTVGQNLLLGTGLSVVGIALGVIAAPIFIKVFEKIDEF